MKDSRVSSRTAIPASQVIKRPHKQPLNSGYRPPSSRHQCLECSGLSTWLDSKGKAGCNQNDQRQRLPARLGETGSEILFVVCWCWCWLPIRRAHFFTARIPDVVYRQVFELVRESELVWASGLVRVWVVEVARFVATESTQRIEDVVEDVVLADPGIVLLETAGEKVHAVGSAEREVAVFCIDEVFAVGGINVLVGHLDGAAGSGLLGGRVTGVEIVPGIVADVVGAFGLIDAEEVDGAVLVGEGDADVCAVDRLGPVGDAISVDLGS